MWTRVVHEVRRERGSGQSHRLFLFFLGGGSVGGAIGDLWEGPHEVGGGILDWEAGGVTVCRDEVEEERVEPAVNLIRY